jgi:hypothetical protein
VVGQIGERGDLAIMVGEREAGNVTEHGECALMNAIQFHERKCIRHAKHDEEQDNANPERSRQLLRSFSHKAFD